MHRMAGRSLRQPSITSPGDGKLHPGRRLTAREFRDWIDDVTRAEWRAGEVIMLPHVSIDEGALAFRIRSLMTEFVEDRRLGEVLGSEVLIRLASTRSWRMPDAMFVSKRRGTILQYDYVDGPPDLIVEVVSPDSVSRDWQQKYIEYAKGGVKEYWVIDRLAGQMEAYTLRPGGRYVQIAEVDGKVASRVLKGFYIRPEWVLGNWSVSRRAAAKKLGVTS